MSVLSKLFSRRRWYVQAALGSLALAVIIGLAFILPSLDNLSQGAGSTPAWASANGYQLVYQLPGTLPSPDENGMCCPPEVPELEALNARLQEWAAAQRESGGEDPVLAMRVMASDTSLEVAVGLPGATLTEAEAMRDYLAGVPGLPEPTISEMTWYYDLGKGIDQQGVAINFGEHQFCFPAGATEEEMEAQIKEYFAQQGEDVDVDISVSTSSTENGEETRIEVRIGSCCESCDDPECEGCE